MEDTTGDTTAASPASPSTPPTPTDSPTPTTSPDLDDPSAPQDADAIPAASDATATAIATPVTTAQLRAQLSEQLERVIRHPVTITSRGARTRGVLVSADFFERACLALGDEPYARPPRTRAEVILEDTARFIQEL